jgi:hypothetical protein
MILDRHKAPQSKRHDREAVPFREKTAKSGFCCNFWKLEIGFGESASDQQLNLVVVNVLSHCHLADQQIACALEHLLLAEGERLGLVQQQQAFHHAGNFEQGPGPHLVRIFLEAELPVVVRDIAFAFGEVIDNFGDIVAADQAAKAYGSYITKRDFNFKIAGLNFQGVELLNTRANGPAANLFYNSNPVIRINDFVTDMKITIHEAPKWPGKLSGETICLRSIKGTSFSGFSQ